MTSSRHVLRDANTVLHTAGSRSVGPVIHSTREARDGRLAAAVLSVGSLTSDFLEEPENALDEQR